MAYKLAQVKYDSHTQRGYVELRKDDSDGGEVVAVAVFSFRTTANLTKRQIEQEIVRKARHIFGKVGDTLSGG